MSKKIKIQDIADNLGLSRNTVSKALNNTGVLAEDTRRRILEKAAEMGYNRMIYIQQEPPKAPGREIQELALITQNMPYGPHFGTYALNTFQEKISQNYFRLSVFPLRNEDIQTCRLPLGFDPDRIKGIVCMELFDLPYIHLLSSLGIPVLFIDTAWDTDFSSIKADFLLMENLFSVNDLTCQLIERGQTRLAFAGEYRHCRSFYERYLGFMSALSVKGLSPFSTSFIEKNVISDSALLEKSLKTEGLPDVFICANDFVAIDLIRALKKLGIQVPKDVKVAGFDNSSESRIIEPHLTTIDIPSSKMGLIAAQMLLSRISAPDMPYQTTHVQTTIIFRESTGELA